MNRQHITTMAIPSVFLLVVSVAAQSQDRFTLKTANGIALCIAVRSDGTRCANRGVVHGKGFEALSRHQRLGVRHI